ncbi:hypothetical protein BKA65DRAFT_505497 [Rhexocercosporidium sp. MPI-PUGE-AT-0058]|nr:hypothetical protein BKA65DRAFT_505497 [Rhexocercosporidium sp. MPI-PUGE-AT-0058]
MRFPWSGPTSVKPPKETATYQSEPRKTSKAKFKSTTKPTSSKTQTRTTKPTRSTKPRPRTQTKPTQTIKPKPKQSTKPKSKSKSRSRHSSWGTFWAPPEPESVSESDPEPQVICPPQKYIPHHRNLGLKPWATQEEVRSAWRKLSMRLHPDKIRDPAQKASAERAMIFVNLAYEELYKDRGGGEGWMRMLSFDVLRWMENWVTDNRLDDSEKLRRQEESVLCWEVVKRKPWIRDYSINWEILGEKAWREAFWVSVVHGVVDGVLPRGVSDWIWEWDGGWRVVEEGEGKGNRTVVGCGRGTERLNFYGLCYSYYVVTLPVARGVRAEVRPNMWSYYRDTQCGQFHIAPGKGDVVLVIILFAIVITLLRRVIAWVVTKCYRTFVMWPICIWWACVRCLWSNLTWPFRWMNGGGMTRFVISVIVMVVLFDFAIEVLMVLI